MTPDSSTFFSTAEWPEPEVLHQELENWARYTADAEPRVVQVGYLQLDDSPDADLGSHLDLILLMEEFDLPLAERVGMWDLGTVPVPAQTLVYTIEEWSEFLESDDPLSQKLKDEVVWVFER
jgi:uncharacterized protein